MLLSSIALASLVFTQASAQQPLQLTCFGAGTANKVKIATVSTNTYESGTVGTTSYSGSG